MVGVVPFGVASDLLALATARTLLRRAARASTGRAIVTLIGGAFAVGFGALAIPMLAAQFGPTEPGSLEQRGGVAEGLGSNRLLESTGRIGFLVFWTSGGDNALSQGSVAPP